MSNPIANTVMMLLGGKDVDTDARPTVDAYVTYDGRTFIARPRIDTRPALPPGLYRYDLQQQGMIFMQQDQIKESIATVDLEQMAVINEVDTFWQAAAFYKQCGLAHKRSLLLYGPPGTGKSTTVRIVTADTIRRGGVVLQFGNIGEFPRAIGDIRALMPDAPVTVVMEEVDRYSSNPDIESRVLEILEGTVRLDHVLFVMTTNYLCRVSDRMKNRPGRVDRCIPVGFPGEESRRAYLGHVLGDGAKPGEVDALAEKTAGMSMAHTKEVLLRERVFGSADVDVLAAFRSHCQMPMDGSPKLDLGGGTQQQTG